MKNLIAGMLLACSLATSAQELFRYEATPMGPLIAAKDLGVGERQIRVDITFKMGQQTGLAGGHIASGVGDLNRYYERGVPPIGEGVIVGAWVGCPDGGTVPSFIPESYYSGPSLDKDSCFPLPDLTSEYLISYWVSVDYKIRMRLVRGTEVLFERERTWAGVHPWHTRGFFLAALEGGQPNGPYTLLKVVVTTEDNPVPKEKQP